jgi:hypothetical protein
MSAGTGFLRVKSAMVFWYKKKFAAIEPVPPANARESRHYKRGFQVPRLSAYSLQFALTER